MASSKGIREVAYFDCAGGGQVVVERNIAYIGNMRNPNGTLIVDVSDPKHPRQIAELSMPPCTHSHKVRVSDGIMVTNREVLRAGVASGEVLPEGFQGGLGIYDVSNPAKPKLITNWYTTDKPGPSYARGVHRFDFDGRYAYISPTMDGYIGNIVMILDLKNPAQPEEVGRWWMPGQWIAGGETPAMERRRAQVPPSAALGNRLYTSYWHGGFVILDIEDMSKPKLVSGLDWSPPFPWPTHTALRIPFKIDNRDFLLVSDEDVVRLEGCPPYPPPSSGWWTSPTSATRRPSRAIQSKASRPRSSRTRPAAISRARS